MGMSVLMAVQCLCTILNVFLALGQYLVMNVGFFFSIGMSDRLEPWSELFLSALVVLCVNLICLSVRFVLFTLYPLLVRFLLCCRIILENCSFFEFVRRYLMASPMATPLLVPGGWYESSRTYSCLFVGLMCVLVCSVLVVSFVSLYTTTSRNTISSWLYSWVNCMELLASFMCVMNCLSSSRVCGHIMNMSSMNLL